MSAGDREIGPGDVREANEPLGPVAGDCVVSQFSFGNDVDASYVTRLNQAGNYGLILVGETGRIAISGDAGDITVHEDGLWAPWQGGHAWTPHCLMFTNDHELPSVARKYGMLEHVRSSFSNNTTSVNVEAVNFNAIKNLLDTT